MAAEPRLICRSDELQEAGKGLRFEIERGGERLPAFAVRHCGRVLAYLNRCAHVGVELDWMPGEFFDESGLYLVCATHGATYEPATGRCIYGPCRGESLTAIDILELNGRVYMRSESHG